MSAAARTVPPPDAAGPPPVASTGPSPTEDDYKEFGRKLEKAVAEGDKAKVDRLVRINDLVARCLSDLRLTEAQKKGFLAGEPPGVAQFSDKLIHPVKNGGSYSFLRVRSVDGRLRVLMRLILPNGGLNYHEYTLIRYPDGQIATEDAYVYTTGEPLTKTFRRLVLGLVAERNQVAAGMTETDQLLTKHLPDSLAMGENIRRGRYKEALAVFRRLPPELQKEKALQVIAIQAAQGTSEADYLAELERFRRDHPNDATADFISMAYYALTKQHDKALELLDRLDKTLGGDPYLNVLRSHALVEAGRFKEARAAAEEAVAEEPKLPHGYWSRLMLAIREKNHADTLTWLKKLVETVEPALNPVELAQDERFTEFVKTPQFGEFRQWAAARQR